MRMFIRCQWKTTGNVALRDRFKLVYGCISGPAVTSVGGENWFHTAMSKTNAKRKILASDLVSGLAYRKSKIMDELDYALSAWNGKDEPDDCRLSVDIFLKRTQQDQLVLNFDSSSERDSFGQILDATAQIAGALGGVALLSSNELMERFQTAVPPAVVPYIGYAAYWATDPTRSNAAYAGLLRAGRLPPTSNIVCRTWTEALSPPAEVCELALLLSGQ